MLCSLKKNRNASAQPVNQIALLAKGLLGVVVTSGICITIVFFRSIPDLV
jgi:hypothetical protein